jgi:hypothetical protein
MLEPIVRVNNARNSGITTIGEIKRKLPAYFVGKIRVKECANPGPSTFWNRNDDGIATGKLTGATAEIPSHDATNLIMQEYRSSGAFSVLLRSWDTLFRPLAHGEHVLVRNKSESVRVAPLAITAAHLRKR